MKFEKEFNECKRYFTPNIILGNCLLQVGSPEQPFFGTAGIYKFGSKSDAQYAAEMIQNILRAVDSFLDEHGYIILKHHMFNGTDPELTDELNEQMMMNARAPMTEISA